jgi:hypothetical protein
MIKMDMNLKLNCIEVCNFARDSSDTGRRECLQVVVNVILVRGDWVPLEVLNSHLLAGAVVHTSKDINTVVVILSAV